MSNHEKKLRETANDFADALEAAKNAGYRVDVFVTPQALRSIGISETAAVKRDVVEPIPTMKNPTKK